jgi:hypothetical protein
MKQNFSQKLRVHSVHQEIYHHLRYLKVHYHVHNSPLSVPTLRKNNPIHTLQTYFSKIHFSSTLLLTLTVSKWSLTLRFSNQTLYTSHLPHASYMPCHLTLLYLTELVFGEEYKLWRSSLCNFLCSPVISPPFDPNILLSTLFSNTPNPCFLNVRQQASHPYETDKINTL